MTIFDPDEFNAAGRMATKFDWMPSTPPVGTAAYGLTPEEQADIDNIGFERDVAREVHQQRARREARRRLDQEEALHTFREPPSVPTLTEELALPDEPVQYRIGDILPKGGNVLLAAQYKAGKTTLIDQVAKSVADSTHFLGKFAVADPGGRIALWNYEIDAAQYRRWLRDVSITNTGGVTVLNLRGYRMPITVRHVEDWIVGWLEEREVKVWVVDPFARAFVGAGKSENDNTEVGAFLDTLDVIKNRAGVTELILPTHTGRAEMEQGEERARGATRLDDWADVRWILTKDENDTRFFRATGRDVEVPEEKLEFDQATRGLTFGGGDRTWVKRRLLEEAVVHAVREEPGISLSKLRAFVRETVKGAGNDAIDGAAIGAERGRLIQIQKGNNGTATKHYPAGLTVLED